MNDLQRSLTKLLRARMAIAGLDWSWISQNASDIVVFGSRATGVNSRSSDLDVLIVAECARVKSSGLDLVCISPRAVKTNQWLSSELAAHVVKYGIWIAGCGEWRHRVSVGPEAVRKKERRLFALLASVSRSWRRLEPAFQRKYQTTIRRELQRLLLLREGIAVPPTPVLDSEWHMRASSVSSLAKAGELLSLSTAAEDFLKTTVLASDQPI